MSLSQWFRDYVYIPLGGSRVGKVRNILNLFLVWLLTGIWHGANFRYVAFCRSERKFHKRKGVDRRCVRLVAFRRSS